MAGTNGASLSWISRSTPGSSSRARSSGPATDTHPEHAHRVRPGGGVRAADPDQLRPVRWRDRDRQATWLPPSIAVTGVLARMPNGRCGQPPGGAVTLQRIEVGLVSADEALVEFVPPCPNWNGSRRSGRALESCTGSRHPARRSKVMVPLRRPAVAPHRPSSSFSSTGVRCLTMYVDDLDGIIERGVARGGRAPGTVPWMWVPECASPSSRIPTATPEKWSTALPNRSAPPHRDDASPSSWPGGVPLFPGKPAVPKSLRSRPGRMTAVMPLHLVS